MMCRYLRFKSRYGGDHADDAGLQALAARNETQFSCLRTCQPWGPDDEIAAPERCSGGRACYASSRAAVS